MNTHLELLPGSFRTEHPSRWNKNITIDNYVVHLRSGFDTVISATKEYIKAEKRTEARKTTTETLLLNAPAITRSFINTAISALKPIFEFYIQRFKDVNITLFNIRMVYINVVLDELMGEDTTWKSMIPYTRISKLTKYGLHMRNFIDDILHYMVKEYVDLKLDVAGMDLYKISPHTIVHTKTDFQI